MTADVVNGDSLVTPATADAVFRDLEERSWFGERGERTSLSFCLPVLVEALKWRGRVRNICEALPNGSPGLNLDLVGFLNAMAHLGYRGTRAGVNPGEIDERLLPCLYFPDDPDAEDNSAMIVLNRHPDGSGDLEGFCGATGEKIRLPVKPPSSGTAFFFERCGAEDEHDIRAIADFTGFSWFRALLERFRGVFRQVFLTGVVLNILSLAAPLFLMLVYDKVIAGRSPESLYFVLVGVILSVATETALRYLRLRTTTWLGSRIDYIVNVAIFDRLLFLSTTFTERASVAAQLARIKSFESVRDFFTGPLFLLVLDVPVSLILIGVIALLAPVLALIPIVTAVLYVALIFVFRPKLKVVIRTAAKSESAKKQLLVESLGKMAALRSSGLTEAWFARLREMSGRASHASFRSAFLSSVVETTAHSLAILAGVCTIAVGTGLVFAGDLSIGALIATMILTWRALAPLQTVCTMLPRLEQLTNSVKQVNRLMDLEPERDTHGATPVARQFQGQVTFSNVGLRYTKDADPVFAGLSFQAEPGQLVALSGSNGAGKSTILKLVNRLYTPQAGSIRIDGADVRQVDPVELRRQIAYVPENPDFFDGTIAENLRLSDPFISDDRLQEALVRADAWDEVSALPYGLNTRIGDGQTSMLSSGLAYRVHLARAYVRDAAIMLFDELPYAILNSAAGTAFKTFLTEAKGKRTVLMVTHREDYVRMADIVVVLRRDVRPFVGTPDQFQQQSRVA